MKLSQKMQERLEKWRKKTTTPPSIVKLKPEKAARRGGKGDHGDVLSIEEWEDEARKSQFRR